MKAAGLAELVALRALVRRADLADAARHTALWCLDQFPGLYADYQRDYSSRYGDAIARLTQGVLMRLGEQGMGKDAGRVAKALVARMGGLHERLGLPALDLRQKKKPA
jgi:hypothetical protein